MKQVVVGAGPAGVIAAETLRRLSPTDNITLIGNEPEPPYSRMAIPYLLMNNIDEHGTYLRKTAGHYDGLQIDVKRQAVTKLAAANNQLTLDNGATVDYDKLLLATGSRPIRPPIPGINNPKVVNCWTLEDARQISAGMQPGTPVVLIGAGFIGCIILEALVKTGAELTVAEMGDRMVPRMLDNTCGGMLQQWCESKGVNVLTSATVSAINDDGDALAVSVEGRPDIRAELVICAAGVKPNCDFVDQSEVALDDGAITINQFMQTSSTNVYAAGDCASGIDFSTGGYSVQAIQPTAVEHGRIAATNMVNDNSLAHKGSVVMNVLDTLGLISASYGLWQGVDGGDSSELLDSNGYKYLRLQFQDDVLIGANSLGLTQHVGVLRGLIQTKVRLGAWKRKLMDNPTQIMEAYLASTQG